MKEFLSTLLQAVLIAAVPVISAFIGKGVQSFSKHLAAKTDNDLAKKYLKEAADAIQEAVSFTNQTYVDTLKKSGTFTEENQAEARQKSLEKATELLTVEARRFLTEAYGDLNSYLLNRIEPEVRRQKQAEPATLSVPLEAVESAPDAATIAATTAAATVAATSAATAAVAEKVRTETIAPHVEFKPTDADQEVN